MTASSVRDVLQQLREQHADLYRSVCNETGAVRPHVNLFVNSSLVPRSSTAAAPLRSGDVVSIMPAVSGG